MKRLLLLPLRLLRLPIRLVRFQGPSHFLGRPRLLRFPTRWAPPRRSDSERGTDRPLHPRPFAGSGILFPPRSFTSRRVQPRGVRWQRFPKDTAGEFTTGSHHLGPSSDASGRVADRTRDRMLVGGSSSTAMPPFLVRKTNRPILPSGRSTVWKIGRDRRELRCSRCTLEPDARQFRRDLVLSAGSLSSKITSGAKLTD